MNNYKKRRRRGHRRVIKAAERAHDRHAQQVVFQNDVSEAPALDKALLDAGDTMEVFLNRIPDGITSEILASQVNGALVNVAQRMEASGKDILNLSRSNYVVRSQLNNERRFAFLLLTPSVVAEELLSSYSGIFMFNRVMRPMRANQAMAGLGLQRGACSEPSAAHFNISHVQAGVLRGDSFDCLWTSHVNPTRNETPSSLEIRLVSKCLAITVAGQRSLKHGNVDQGTFSSQHSQLHIEIPFFSVLEPMSSHVESYSDPFVAVYFRIAHPAFLFRSMGTSRKTTTWNSNHDAEFDDVRFTRTIDFTDNEAWAKSNAIRIFFSVSSNNDKAAYNLFLSRIRETRLGGKHISERPATVRTIMKTEFVSLADVMRDAAQVHRIPFAVRFHVESVVSMGVIPIDDLTYEFWHVLGRLSTKMTLLVLDGMKNVASEESGLKINAERSLREVLRYYYPSDESDTEEDTKQSYQNILTSVPTLSVATRTLLRDLDRDTDDETPEFVPIRRVTVTPTRAVACAPELDMMNRVLRSFSKYRDRFIRVTFCDEDGDSISYNDPVDLFTRVQQKLNNGIEVAGEHFVFLAYSSSGLREHMCWMYAENLLLADNVDDIAPTIHEIWQWFGDFRHIRVPSRYAARIGQAFSSTVKAISLKENQVKEVDDIWDRLRKYRFSDGVGTISENLTRRVARRLQLDPKNPPSAFQIRFAGAKGVLSVSPNSNNEIVLRKSMVKFSAEQKDLEVVGYSKRLPFYLNRQIITILESIGVPSQVFVDIQDDLLIQIDKCIDKDRPDVALKLLRETGNAEIRGDRYIRNVGPVGNAALLLKAGFTTGNCEYLYNIMCAFRNRILHGVRTKARIPLEKGTSNIGIMDEFNVLRPNEIFVQYTDIETGNTLRVEGDVIVGRHPSLHPGDLQKARAVYRPELSHLVDVIVFSQVGIRPIPSMLSGGDLDGDVYFVIWDERIILANANQNPMSYEAAEEHHLDRNVEMEDVKKFMVQYIRNDKLGMIASAHLVHADREGVFSDKCIRLAQLHSAAVDYAKTGIPAKMDRDLSTKNQAGMYPDFMERHRKVSYVSKTALGLMYRKARDAARKQNWSEIVDSSPIDKIMQQFKYNSELDDDADELAESWNTRLQQLMDTYGIETEGEICSGQIKKFQTNEIQSKGRMKFIERVQVVKRHYKALTDEYREIFFEDISTNFNELNLDALMKACAWYMANERQKKADLALKKKPKHSFPYIVADVLAKVITPHLGNFSRTNISITL